MAIRVLISEQHTALQADLRALLCSEPAIEVVGEASSWAEVYQLARDLLPDIILLDISLPDLYTIQSIAWLRQAMPDVRVLLLINSEDIILIRDALAAGADGYVISQSADRSLVAAIQTVAQNHLYIRPGVVRALLAELPPPPVCTAQRTEDLTPCEAQIVCLIAQGYTNRQVAEQLGLGAQAVQRQRAHIMAKLGLHSRLELMQYAAAHRLDQPRQ